MVSKVERLCEKFAKWCFQMGDKREAGGGSAGFYALGVRGGREMKTYFKGGTAVPESLEVLTCSWAACQPEHPPVTILSRVVQLDSSSISHS